MLGTEHLGLFLVSALLLNLTPGQDTLYILGRSLSQGRRAGLVSVAGIVAGCAVHTVAAALGLSAILAASAAAMIVVKAAGAAYLCYLGLQLILDRRSAAAIASQSARESSWAIFRAGLLTNVLNPKVGLFFLAFLPQFVAPDADAKAVSMLFLGLLFITTGTLWCLVLALAASTASGWLRRGTSASLALRRATGALFVGLGVRLAVSK